MINNYIIAIAFCSYDKIYWMRTKKKYDKVQSNKEARWN